MEKALVEFSHKTLTQNSNWEVIQEASVREGEAGQRRVEAERACGHEQAVAVGPGLLPAGLLGDFLKPTQSDPTPSVRELGCSHTNY